MKMLHPIKRQSAVARLGALGWIVGTVQFFVCHLVVQSAWPTPYSWSLNNVSDLGNVYCQPWGDNARARYVCSPLHDLMNVSFIVEGLLIAAGVLLIGSLWSRALSSRAARAMLVIAGLAIVVAGLAPADIDENVHVVLGALPITFLGNIGLILAGLAPGPGQRGKARLLGPVIGGIGLVATLLFFSGHYLGLGMGGMERCAGFNVIAWTALMGCYLLIFDHE
jgi:hypothetical membrane protein